MCRDGDGGDCGVEKNEAAGLVVAGELAREACRGFAPSNASNKG